MKAWIARNDIVEKTATLRFRRSKQPHPPHVSVVIFRRYSSVQPAFTLRRKRGVGVCNDYCFLSNHSFMCQATLRRTIPHSPTSQQALPRLHPHYVGNVGWVSSTICSLITHRRSPSISANSLHNTPRFVASGAHYPTQRPHTPLTSRTHDALLVLPRSIQGQRPLSSHRVLQAKRLPGWLR